MFAYFGPQWTPGTQLFDNKNQFFETGFAQTHNLGVDFGIKKSLFRFSGTFFDQNGVVPENNFRRFNLRLTNTTKFWKDKIEINPSIAYIKSENNKVLRSAGGYLLSLLVWQCSKGSFNKPVAIRPAGCAISANTTAPISSATARILL